MKSIDKTDKNLNMSLKIQSFLGKQTAKWNSLYTCPDNDTIICPFLNELHVMSHKDTKIHKFKIGENPLQSVSRLDDKTYITNNLNGQIFFFNMTQNNQIETFKTIYLSQQNPMNNLSIQNQQDDYYINFFSFGSIFLYKNSELIFENSVCYNSCKLFKLNNEIKIFAIRGKKEFYLEIVDLQGKIEKSKLFSEGKNLHFNIFDISQNIVIVTSSDKRLFLINLTSFHIKEILFSQASMLGPIFLRNDQLTLNLGKNIWIQFFIQDIMKIDEVIVVFDYKRKNIEQISVYESQVFLGSADICISVDQKFESMLVCGSMTKRWIKSQNNHIFLQKEVIQIEENIVQTTCCGASISLDRKLLAIGDFGGQVHIYDSQNLDQSLMHYKGDYIEVRSLKWLKQEKKNEFKLIIGIQGFVELLVFNFDKELQLLEKTKKQVGFATITNIREQIYKNEQIIILSTTHGQIFILDKQLNEILQFQAHFPNKELNDSRYPSLHKKNEIWSICTNKGDFDYLITASEDSSLKLFSVKSLMKGDFNHLQEIYGHERAATSIEWQQDVMISCSDDNTLRIYKFINEQFEFQHQLNSHFIKGWHTLTYLTLQKNLNYVSVVTEHGYLIVWKLDEKLDESQKVLYSKQIHMGSIEALDQNEDCLLSCSSDGGANFITFDFVL